MLQVEIRLSKYQVKSARRADIVVERFNGDKGELSPLAIVECKAPEVMVGDSAIQQVIDYADDLNAEYIFVTNGNDTIIAKYEAGSNQYVLGSPLFRSIKLHLENGKTVTISAPENTHSSKYVQKLYIDGNEYNHNYVTHEQLQEGAMLEFKMSETPNKLRGIDIEDAPYSFSKSLEK